MTALCTTLLPMVPPLTNGDYWLLLYLECWPFSSPPGEGQSDQAT